MTLDMTRDELKKEYDRSLKSVVDTAETLLPYDVELGFIDMLKRSPEKALPLRLRSSAMKIVPSSIQKAEQATNSGTIIGHMADNTFNNLFFPIIGAAGTLFKPRKKRAKISNLERKKAQEQLEKKYKETEQRELINHIRHEKKKTFPGQQLLEKISATNAKRFQQRAQQEARWEMDDYQDLLRNQIAGWEQLLRNTFLQEPNRLIDSILGACKKEEAEILSMHFTSDNPHTIFVLELWIRGLRRQLQSNNPVICQWITENFAPTVKRHLEEEYLTLQTFGSKEQNLPAFISAFRQKRNPIMHGEVEKVSLHEYQEWCDFAYGTSSLLQWLNIGVNPAIYKPNHFGWLSFIVSAKATHQPTKDVD